MTGQIPDIVFYESNSYSLLGVDGKNLFKPEDFGINKTSSFNAACARGYMRFFRVTNNELLLEKIWFWVKDKMKMDY